MQNVLSCPNVHTVVMAALARNCHPRGYLSGIHNIPGFPRHSPGKLPENCGNDSFLFSFCHARMFTQLLCPN